MAHKDYSLEKKVKEQSLSVIFFILIGVVLITSIIVSTRIDLTKNNIYSISKISQDIIKGIEEPVYIDYYVSPKLTINDERPQQIIDLLQEYSSRSKGKVIFTQYDTTKEGIEQKIEGYKLEPKQVQVVEKDQVSAARVYSGIVIQYLDRQSVLPFVLDPVSIEYQVTSKILEVYNDKERTIGVLVLDNTISYEQDLKVLVEQVLSIDAKVEKIEMDSPISDDIDSLFVVGSKDISNDTAYYIDQFVMSGRGVFFAADKVHIDLRTFSGVEQDNLLLQMLSSYGVNIENKIIADELHKGIPTQNSIFPQPYALWITANGKYVNHNHPLTTNFSGWDSYWTSPIKYKGSNSDSFVSLISTSDKAWTVSAIAPNVAEGENEASKSFPMQDPNNYKTYKNNANSGQYTVVGALQGPLESATKNRLIRVPAGINDTIESASIARFVVTGNVNILTGLFQYTNAGYNFNFISSAADWLGSNEKLLGIKSRVTRNTQLNKIVDVKKKEGLILVVKLLNMVLIPIIIIVCAVLVLSYRRNLSKRRY